jgi:hypothetical protein
MIEDEEPPPKSPEETIAATSIPAATKRPSTTSASGSSYGRRSVTTPRITGKFKVPLNVERTLGGGGTNSHNAVFVLTVRKAQLDDLKPKRLSVHFGLDLPKPDAR